MTNYIFSNSGDDLYNVYKNQDKAFNFVRTCEITSYASALHPEKFIKPDYHRDCYLPEFKAGLDKIVFKNTDDIRNAVIDVCGSVLKLEDNHSTIEINNNYFYQLPTLNLSHLREGDSYSCCLIARLKDKVVDFVGVVVPGIVDCETIAA